MIHGQNFFDKSVKNNLATYDSIRKIATSQGDNSQLVVCWTIIISAIAIVLNKQQAFEADP